MAKINDFDLDLKVKEGSTAGKQARITSISLCTPGCITGDLMTCRSNGCK